MIKDYQILKETIIRSINNSSLDIGAAYFILKSIFCEIENLYFAQINRELMEENQKNVPQQTNKTQQNIEKENDICEVTAE